MKKIISLSQSLKRNIKREKLFAVAIVENNWTKNLIY